MFHSCCYLVKIHQGKAHTLVVYTTITDGSLKELKLYSFWLCACVCVYLAAWRLSWHHQHPTQPCISYTPPYVLVRLPLPHSKIISLHRILLTYCQLRGPFIPLGCALKYYYTRIVEIVYFPAQFGGMISYCCGFLIRIFLNYNLLFE